MRNNSWLFLFMAFLLAISISSCVSVRELEMPVIESPGYVYDSVLIEIQPFKGNVPSEAQLDSFREAIWTYQIAPQNRISFVIRDPVDIDKTMWWRHEVNAYERRYRILADTNTNDRNLIMWMGFLHGRFMDPKYVNTIGLHYGDTSTVVLGSTNSNTRKSATMLHEFLHVIGLVDLTHRSEAPVNPDRPSHCNNEDCVMFWVVTERPVLCEKCQLDLRLLR